MSDRVSRLWAMPSASDAIAVVPGANLRYLTGLDMPMSERITIALFPASGCPAIVLPALEAPRAQAQAGVTLAFYPWSDEDGPDAALRRCADDLSLAGRCVGVEYATMRVLELRALELVAPGLQVVDATPQIALLRMVKDAHELAAMRAAVQVVEQALQAAITQVRVGMTERALAGLWEQGIRAAGGVPSFTTIVASGPNSANPHHSNTDRAFQSGDLIVMDGGALVDGYVSDITRTIALGEVSPELRQVYELVLAANRAGRAAARPGSSGAEVDQAARAVITAGGYGPCFPHRTGHGLGLEVHEPPYMVAGSHTPLAEGMTFTVEPGVYVPGVGGVRIEDDVVITAQGAESLTTFKRELLIVHAS